MDYILKLVDKTPYVWWKGGQSTFQETAPFYCKTLPSVVTVQTNGTNCAGLINLIQLTRGLEVPGVSTNEYYAGGTYVWFEHLKEKLKPIDVTKSYVAGSLLLRQYRSEEDQGHLAVLYTSGPLLEQRLLHCYPDKGVTIDDTVKESHDWIKEGYYEYIVENWFFLP